MKMLAILFALAFTACASNNRKPNAEGSVEVLHEDGKIVLYRGLRKSSIVRRVGETIIRGETLGYLVGKTLEFEMYEGTSHGPLIDLKHPSHRRSDLRDPTQYLLEIERQTFASQ